MYFDKYILFVCLSLIPSSLSVDVCGLENVPKCEFTDVKCLNNLLRAIRSWCQTPQAKGFFVTPVDPLQLSSLELLAGSKQITFTGVSIVGISNGTLDINVATDIETGLTNTFTYNLSFEAKKYKVVDLSSNRVLANRNANVRILFANAKTTNGGDLGMLERCEGTTYFNPVPNTPKCIGGQVVSIEGFKTRRYGIDGSTFKKAILEKVSTTATSAVYKNERQLFSIAPFNAFYITGDESDEQC